MTQNKHYRVYALKIAGGIILLAGIAYVVHVIMNFASEKPVKHERKIQPVDLVKPPPPPPPPPKVEPPPPEPEMEKVNEPEPEPEPLPDVPDQQPAGDTGLDAEGTAGTDAFGLAAKKGGRGLLGGGGGDPNMIYAGVIKQELLEILSDHDELRSKSYSAVIKIWLNPDGSVAKFELSRGSNDTEIDKLLNKLVAKFKKAKDAPPPGMAQPIKLKISSRI